MFQWMRFWIIAEYLELMVIRPTDVVSVYINVLICDILEVIKSKFL